MPLAPFFDRTRQSAAQVLANFDAAAFEARLNDVQLTIAFDAAAATSPEARCSLDLATRLAARLYPRIRIASLGGAFDTASEALVNELRHLARSINPGIEFEEGGSAATHVAVVAGGTAFEADQVIYMGSDRWVARVASAGPLGSATSENPFGAGAAACIAMANVFRAVFGDSLARPALDDDVWFSLLDFQVGPDGLNADLPSEIDLKVVQLIGVGAIGNAFAWSLAHLPVARGELHLIDHETIDLTNLQRYVLTTMADVDGSKVELARTTLAHSMLSVLPHPGTWSDYVASNGHRLERVAVALDTASDRVMVQSSLPRRIHNAWTQTGDLGVSRHRFGGGEACLACLYLPTAKHRNEDEIVAQELGFTGDEQLRAIRAMLYLGNPVGEGFVQQVATNLGIDAVTLMPFASLPLRSFRQKAICGNIVVRASDGASADLEVPLAFQSALAGIMLAADVAGACSGLQPPLATKTVIDLLRTMPSQVTWPVRSGAPGTARCICQDPDYGDVYHRKYG